MTTTIQHGICDSQNLVLGSLWDRILNHVRARHVQERRLCSSEANRDKIEEHAVLTRVASRGWNVFLNMFEISKTIRFTGPSLHTGTGNNVQAS